MIEGAALPTVGGEITLKLAGTNAIGMVVWEVHGRCGVAFKVPLSEEEVQRQRLMGEYTARTGSLPGEWPNPQ
jgi:hypothetical protein